jgi:hypothetical protein
MNHTAIPIDHDAHPDPMADAANAPGGGSDVSNAAGGAAAGAIAGTVVAGPVGTVIGAALGAIAGGITGSSSAEAIDPAQEEAYWREHFVHRPYVENGSSFDDYGPAFGYGVSAHTQYAGRSFDSIETDLSHGWNAARGASKLDWDRARNATRDAWDRVSDAGGGAIVGASDRDRN